MDHVRGRGSRVIAGETDDRAIGRQIAERAVQDLDHLLLSPWVFRVSRRVSALDVTEDESVARIEPFACKRNPTAQVGSRVRALRFLPLAEPDRERESAEEGRARDERSAEPVPLLERR